MRLSLNKVRRAALQRRTREREAILDRVASFAGHFSAEDLLLSLGRHRKRISRATVYRTLDLLLDRGVVQRVSLDRGGARYEMIQNRPQHAHLYCLGCGSLTDYPLPLLSELPARVRRQRGFQAEHLLLRICGYCRKCAAGPVKRVAFRGVGNPTEEGNNGKGSTRGRRKSRRERR